MKKHRHKNITGNYIIERTNADPHDIYTVCVYIIKLLGKYVIRFYLMVTPHDSFKVIKFQLFKANMNTFVGTCVLWTLVYVIDPFSYGSAFPDCLVKIVSMFMCVAIRRKAGIRQLF